MKVGRFLFPDRLRHRHRRAGEGAGGARLRFAVRARAHPHPAQPQVALPRRRRAAQALFPHARSVRGLSFAAAATKKLKLGTGICLVPQHEPIVTAKSIASLDQLSGGRFVFGIGAGWNVDEMENHGVQLRRPLQADARARAGHEGALDQGRGRATTASSSSSIRSGRGPSRSSGRIRRSLLGGETDHTLRRVVDYCDGWFPRARARLRRRQASIARLHKMAAEEGPRSQDARRSPCSARRQDAEALAELREGRHRRRAAGDPRRQPRRDPALSRQDRAAGQARRRA